MKNLLAPLPPLALGALLAGTLHLTAGHATTQSGNDATAFIQELGLREAPTALRDQPGWRKPRTIIVPKDGYDLAWLREAAPGVEFIVARDDAEAEAAAPRADAVFAFCSAKLLERGHKIRWMQLMNAGVERCLANTAIAERGILVTNMQRVAGPAMAEHVMAMLLSISRGLPMYLRQQEQSRWDQPSDEDSPAFVLQDKTMLIAGLGGIGTEVARRAHAFGMRIVATSASNRPAPEFVSHLGPPEELLALAREADVIVNSLPLTAQTTRVFDAKIFSAMKPTAVFINVGRGGTVDTGELVKALQEKRLRGAALDVADPEPLPSDHPLWRMPNVVITPHVSADTDRGRTLRWQVARENLRRYVAGERMLSVVDVKRGY